MGAFLAVVVAANASWGWTQTPSGNAGAGSGGACTEGPSSSDIDLLRYNRDRAKKTLDEDQQNTKRAKGELAAAQNKLDAAQKHADFAQGQYNKAADALRKSLAIVDKAMKNGASEKDIDSLSTAVMHDGDKRDRLHGDVLDADSNVGKLKDEVEYDQREVGFRQAAEDSAMDAFQKADKAYKDAEKASKETPSTCPPKPKAPPPKHPSSKKTAAPSKPNLKIPRCGNKDSLAGAMNNLACQESGG